MRTRVCIVSTIRQSEIGQVVGKKVKCDGQTDRPMDRRTDGLKKRGVESRSTRLKTERRRWYDDDCMLVGSADMLHCKSAAEKKRMRNFKDDKNGMKSM